MMKAHKVHRAHSKFRKEETDKIKKAYKYRVYPNKTAQKELDTCIELCRQLYNYLLIEVQRVYKLEEKHLSLKELRQLFYTYREEHPEYKQYSQSLFQDVITYKIDGAYKGFFKLMKKYKKGQLDNPPGVPKEQEPGEYNTVVFWQNTYKIDGNYLYLPKTNTRVKIKLHRPIDGVPKTAVLKRIGNKYYLSITCQCSQEVIKPKKADVGIDLGLITFVHTSEDEKLGDIKDFKPYTQVEPKIKQIYKSMSKKKKGSYRYNKLKIQLDKEYEKIRRKRRDTANKVSAQLLNKYGIIYCEDLKPSEMIQEKNGKRLRKSIADVAWGALLENMESKAGTIEGRKVIKVDPRYTTKMCSQCWNIVDIELKDRIFICPHCSFEIDRDLNAAINVLSRGRNEIQWARFDSATK